MLRALCGPPAKLRPEQLVHFLRYSEHSTHGLHGRRPQGPFLPYVRFDLWLPKQVTTNRFGHSQGWIISQSPEAST